MVLFNKLIDTSLRFGFWCLTPLSTIFQLVLLVEKIGVLGESHLCRPRETQGTQDEEKQSKNTTQYKLDTTIQPQALV
jgi:hypothetical protein